MFSLLHEPSDSFEASTPHMCRADHGFDVGLKDLALMCAAFIKAFFDGEGSTRGRQLTVYNTDRQLLIYIVEPLKTYFGIETTGPHIARKRGTVVYCPRTKRAYKLNKHCYSLYVRTRSLTSFYQHVGFIIERKRRRLAEAAKQ